MVGRASFAVNHLFASPLTGIFDDGSIISRVLTIRSPARSAEIQQLLAVGIRYVNIDAPNLKGKELVRR